MILQSFSASMCLSWMYGKVINIQEYQYEVDMSVRIRQRALQGYGLHVCQVYVNSTHRYCQKMCFKTGGIDYCTTLLERTLLHTNVE